MSTVILEGLAGVPWGPATWMGQKVNFAPRKRLEPADLLQLAAELRAQGMPSRESLDRLKATHPAIAKAWERWLLKKKATAPAPAPQLQGLPGWRPRNRPHPIQGRYPRRHAAACGLLGEVGTSSALQQILSVVHDGSAAQAYYGALPEVHAIDNLERERAWTGAMDLLQGLVRKWVKPGASRAEVEELALRIGLASDASGSSIVPDRKLKEHAGARHASWMGGAIGYGGMSNWDALVANAKQYLDQGFQWAEIFGRWSDPNNARTLGNDSGVYPYLPTWAQAIAAKAWRNRRIIEVELGSQDGFHEHAEQRSKSWDAQMEPINPSMRMGGLEAADAVIRAGVAANQVAVSAPDPVYQAPWEIVEKPAPRPAVTLEVPTPISPSGGAPVQALDSYATNEPGNVNGPLKRVDLPSNIPTLAPIVERTPAPVFDVPAPTPIPATVASNTVGVTATQASASPVGVTVPASTVALSTVPPGAQSMAAMQQQAELQAMAEAQAQAQAQAAGGSWFDQEMIPGVSNKLLVGGAAALVVLLLVMKRD